MGQKKLIRFAAIQTFPNVLQYPEDMAGRWAGFFRNMRELGSKLNMAQFPQIANLCPSDELLPVAPDHPLTLELACGKGEYTVGMAKMYPQRNFLGVDLKGNRIYIGAKKCLQENITNAAFLRTQIDRLPTYFKPGEVEEIWLTFPDPQLRKSKARKRLTHPKFLRLYQQILTPGGHIHLKTDSPLLYNFTRLVIDMYGLTLLESSDNIYADADPLKEELKIKTHYEGLDIAGSQRIHYLHFTLPATPLPSSDEALQQKVREMEPDAEQQTITRE